MPTTIDHARDIFRRHGGTLRTTEALAAGIHPRTLYAMRDTGQLEALARGVNIEKGISTYISANMYLSPFPSPTGPVAGRRRPTLCFRGETHRQQK